MVGGSPASSTTKAGRHDIAEILLKVALNTIQCKSNQINSHSFMLTYIYYLLCLGFLLKSHYCFIFTADATAARAGM